MSQTLYRKYRPQTFAELVGQDHIRQTITNQLKTGQIVHAYLFSGPRGIGKTTTARLLAKAINCQNRKQGEAEPCGQCRLCVALQEGRALDVIEIDAASQTGVDNVRENIIASSRVPPIEGKMKIFIIDEAHMLSGSAFNALLKIIEEPPAHILFILATTEIHKVPETVISRCQRFDFRKVPHKLLVERLAKLADFEKMPTEIAVLDRIAVASGGCLRDAENLFGQVLALADAKVTETEADIILPKTDNELLVEFVSLLIKCDTTKAILFINRLVEDGVSLPVFAQHLILFLRKLILLTVSREVADSADRFSPTAEEFLQTTAKTLPLAKSQEYMKQFLQVREELNRADILQIPFELAIIDLCENNSLQAQTRHDNYNDPPSALPANNNNNNHQPETTPPAEQEKNQEKNNSTNTAVVTKEIIEQSWRAITKEVKEKNRTLAAFLKLGALTAVEEGTVTLQFRYQFYHDRVNELKNRRLIEDVLTSVLGTRLSLNIQLENGNNGNKINGQPTVKNEIADPALKQILDVFGGQVIES